MKNKTRKTLKNLLFATIPISIASFLPMNEAKGQNRIIDPNVIYLTFYPGDLGLGIRYDRRFDKRCYKWGTYSSLSRGKCRLEGDEYINNHIKAGLGAIYYPQNKFFKEHDGFFGVGPSYHDYGKRNYTPGTINEEGFHPLSIDFSAGLKIEHFNFFINVDPFKQECGVGAGISFGALSKNPIKKYRKLLAEVYSKTQ